MLTSEKVTKTALALPNGLSVIRRFSVPCDPDGAEGPEGEPDSPLQAKVVRTAAAARTDARRMVFSCLPKGKMSSTPPRVPKVFPQKALSAVTQLAPVGLCGENRNRQGVFVTRDPDFTLLDY
jgi:hypothetical protein